MKKASIITINQVQAIYRRRSSGSNVEPSTISVNLFPSQPRISIIFTYWSNSIVKAKVNIPRAVCHLWNICMLCTSVKRNIMMSTSHIHPLYMPSSRLQKTIPIQIRKKIPVRMRYICLSFMDIYYFLPLRPRALAIRDQPLPYLLGPCTLNLGLGGGTTNGTSISSSVSRWGGLCDMRGVYGKYEGNRMILLWSICRIGVYASNLRIQEKWIPIYWAQISPLDTIDGLWCADRRDELDLCWSSLQRIQTQAFRGTISYREYLISTQ